MATIRTTAPIRESHGFQFDTPTGGVAVGEVIQINDVIAYAFGEADPDELTNQFSNALDSAGDVVYMIQKSNYSQITDMATGSGTPTFSVGDNVWWNLTTHEPENSNSAENVWIGTAKTARTVSQTGFEIEFNGTNPTRTA